MKQTLVINPFEYKYREKDPVEMYMEGLKDFYDTYIVLSEGTGQYAAEGVSFVEAGTRKQGYLEVTADLIIDAGAVTGSSKLSGSQKRICIDNKKLKETLPQECEKDDLIKAIDYYSVFDKVVHDPNDAADLIDELKRGATDRKYGEVLFLMEYLEQEDDFHKEILALARLFKREFGSKLYAIGLKEIGLRDVKNRFYDSENIFDLKLSTENNPGTVRNILIETDGIVIICDKEARHGYRNYISGNRLVYMYKGGNKYTDVNKEFRNKDFENPKKWDEIFDYLCKSGNDVSVSVEKAESLAAKTIKKVQKIGGKSNDTQGSGTETLIEEKTTEEPLVSVVIPFYNDSATITNAVESIKTNGYGNYEIILVNDGSDEDPMALLDKDDKIKYFYKKNGGPGSARNLGIDKSQGKYLLFLDSDDISLPGAIGKMVCYAEKSDADMVCGKTIRRYAETGREEEWCGGCYTRERIISMSERGSLIDDTICHGKLYRMDSLKQAGLLFGDGLYEDNAFMGKVYSSLATIGVIPDPVQKWMIYGQKTSRSTENTFNNAKARLQVVDNIYCNADDRLKVYYTRQYIRHQIIACLNGYNDYSDEEKYGIFQSVKEGLGMRRDTILDRLILMPSKKELYKAILNDDYERFDQIANGFSALYLKDLKKN